MPGDVAMFRKVIKQDMPQRPISTTAPANTPPCWPMQKCAACRLRPTWNIPSGPAGYPHDLRRNVRTSTEKVELGIDGCSAPNFAVPLYNAALGMARLCDPRSLSETRAGACRKITSAMVAHPEMVSNHGEFDCELMKTCKGKVITKRGAEGFQIIGLMPGEISPIRRNRHCLQSHRRRCLAHVR